MKTKPLTDKEIQEQIKALEEANRNTMWLSRGRGHGWGDTSLEKRRDKIQYLQSILFVRRIEKTKPTPKEKKQGLTRVWNAKTKQWVYTSKEESREISREI